MFKDLNTINFELRDKRSGRMSLICKPCNRIKINIRNNAPERKNAALFSSIPATFPEKRIKKLLTQT